MTRDPGTESDSWEERNLKRATLLFVATAMAVGLLAGTAGAGGHQWHEDVEPHGHVMLLGVELSENGVSYHRCVEFAAGRILRGPAHHHSVHTGAAGGSPFVQGALWNAGHAVIPLYPFVPFPWFGCESFPNPWIPPVE